MRGFLLRRRMCRLIQSLSLIMINLFVGNLQVDSGVRRSLESPEKMSKGQPLPKALIHVRILNLADLQCTWKQVLIGRNIKGNAWFKPR